MMAAVVPCFDPMFPGTRMMVGATAHGNATLAAGSMITCIGALDHCKSRLGALPEARVPRLL